MPVYDFECTDCGCFAVMRRIAERDEPCRCPACGGAASRLVSAPSLALMTDVRRRAHTTNERAAHAPNQSANGAPMRHGPGCGCCASGRAALAGASRGAAAGGLKQPAGRPWMISH